MKPPFIRSPFAEGHEIGNGGSLRGKCIRYLVNRQMHKRSMGSNGLPSLVTVLSNRLPIPEGRNIVYSILCNLNVNQRKVAGREEEEKEEVALSNTPLLLRCSIVHYSILLPNSFSLVIQRTSQTFLAQLKDVDITP
ncbi:hypothetical protein M0802_000294 [Mischocyttarus mexicanus]|nr:hypothetical protein M0802_000294 [Mischocyttarus mexicanus]